MLIPLLCIILSFQTTLAQTVISGSTCVIAGAQYNYVLSGNYTVNIVREWCVTNGTIVGGSGNCSSSNGYTSISIIWNNGATNGSLSMAACRSRAWPFTAATIGAAAASAARACACGRTDGN